MGLGISIYPEHSKKEEILNYIKKAGSLGFKKIFTCLLSVDSKEKDDIKALFKEVCSLAHSFNMEVIVDVSPSVFENLDISYDNLRFFKEIGADTIRLDETFDGLKESLMTYNKEGLKIELNGSFGNRYIDLVMSFNPNLKKVTTCHNFYPQKLSGLSLNHFNKCNEQIKKYGLNIAGFISSKQENTFGPWPVYDGLCTLEMHRNLDISAQARHLFATRMIDDVIIGNCYASDKELELLASLDEGILTFDIEFEGELSQIERQILYYDDIHIVRGNMSEYTARSTQPRLKFSKDSIPARNTRDLKRGDIIILNDNYPKYKGELQIVLQDMENDGKKNVVGKIPQTEIFLLEYLTCWKPFKFIEY